MHSYKLMLVGDNNDKIFFQSFFKQIHLVKNNREALVEYELNKISILFLSCNDKSYSAIDTALEIREKSRSIILVILAEKISNEKLIKALSLNLSGYMKKPFKVEEVNMVFKNISKDLTFFSENSIRLKESYRFCTESNTLYNRENKEIKLTKNEMKLMSIMTKNKEPYVGSELLEHKIWEDASAYEDCNKRLKYLIYGLRKKLAKNTIINSYKLGYKLVLE